jgi:hypothetical protein
VATVETASFVGTRVPGRGGSYAPRPSLSAGDNSLAVDLFRRSEAGLIGQLFYCCISLVGELGSLKQAPKNGQVPACRTDAAYVFTIGESRNQLCATAVAGNTHETIAWLHDSFAVLFSRLFSRHASNPERSYKRGLMKWDGVKQRLLI